MEEYTQVRLNNRLTWRAVLVAVLALAVLGFLVHDAFPSAPEAPAIATATTHHAAHDASTYRTVIVGIDVPDLLSTLHSVVTSMCRANSVNRCFGPAGAVQMTVYRDYADLSKYPAPRCLLAGDKEYRAALVDAKTFASLIYDSPGDGEFPLHAEVNAVNELQTASSLFEAAKC
jgi:hypothetical protein